MGENITLICSFYSFSPVVASIHAFSPSKIIVVVSEGALKKNPDVKADYEKLVSVFAQVAKVEKVEVDGADLLGIAKKTTELLEADTSTKIVNISGAWKLLSEGLLYGCYARPYLVSRIICNNLDRENEIVNLPKFSFELSNGKRSVLEAIESISSKIEGKVEVSEIAKKIEKSDVMIYQHLENFRDMNYLDANNRITDAGKIALLWKGEKK